MINFLGLRVHQSSSLIVCRLKKFNALKKRFAITCYLLYVVCWLSYNGTQWEDFYCRVSPRHAPSGLSAVRVGWHSATCSSHQHTLQNVVDGNLNPSMLFLYMDIMDVMGPWHWSVWKCNSPKLHLGCCTVDSLWCWERRVFNFCKIVNIFRTYQVRTLKCCLTQLNVTQLNVWVWRIFSTAISYLLTSVTVTIKVINRSGPSYQLNKLDNAGGSLEVSHVESDLYGLRVGAGVRGDRHLGLSGWLRPSVDITHHPDGASQIITRWLRILIWNVVQLSEKWLELISSSVLSQVPILRFLFGCIYVSQSWFLLT